MSKIGHLFSAVILGLTLSTSSALATGQTCCTRAKAAGKECDHLCCTKARKEKKVCEKCNPKKAEEKKAQVMPSAAKSTVATFSATPSAGT